MSFEKIKGMAHGYNEAVQNNTFITKGVKQVHDALGRALFKLGIFGAVVLFLLGGCYIAFQKASGGEINFFAQLAEDQVVEQVLNEMHRISFDNLGSDRFQLNANGVPAVCSVVMGDVFYLPASMVGEKMPMVPHAFLSSWNSFAVRSFQLSIDIAPQPGGGVLKLLSENSKPVAIRRSFHAVRNADGGFETVPFELFKAYCDKQIDDYRENLRHEALEHLRKRETGKSGAYGGR